MAASLRVGKELQVQCESCETSQTTLFLQCKETKIPRSGEEIKKKWRLGMKVHRRHLQCNPSVVKARR